MDKKIISNVGYLYSSLKNYKSILQILNDDKIYQKYFRILKQVFIYIKRNQFVIENENYRIKLYEKFSFRIEKFCMLHFHTIDFSIFKDIFNRIINDIFIKLSLIKLSNL
jgi:hypothetical protein